MKFLAMRAPAGSRLILDGFEPGTRRNERIAVVTCERGTVLTTPSGIISLSCVLAGGAGVMNGEWSIELGKTDICVGAAQTRHELVVSPRGACIVIAGTATAWAALAGSRPFGMQPSPVLFPAVHRSVRAACKRLLRFVRHCRSDDQASATYLARQLACVVDELQSGFAAMIARCPGSSLTRKKAVFLRLQRVRNHIGACAHHELDVAKLALMANYSVGHFITTYRSVFEETPYSNVSRHRVESASTLLSGSTLGIADIAQAIGFQSRSSFTRAIKKHLGSSATEFRETSEKFPGVLDEDAISNVVGAGRRSRLSTDRNQRQR